MFYLKKAESDDTVMVFRFVVNFKWREIFIIAVVWFYHGFVVFRWRVNSIVTRK
jgi:hypothetical protein